MDFSKRIYSEKGKDGTMGQKGHDYNFWDSKGITLMEFPEKGCTNTGQ